MSDINNAKRIGEMDQVLGAIVRAAASGVTTQAILWAIEGTCAGTTKLVLYHDGDESVGIPRESACVELDLRHCAAAERAVELERASALLAAAFSELWGARAKVRVVPANSGGG